MYRSRVFKVSQTWGGSGTLLGVGVGVGYR